MKETRYFYAPDAVTTDELPEDEALHALRVLRLKSGDEMILMDGRGNFYRTEVTLASSKHCGYRITETMPQTRQWRGRFHIGIAPTKMIDRMEWMIEKATEIGIDRISFLDCRFSERRVLKTSRLDKIVISAMKQSRKAWKPMLNDMETFEKFISRPISGCKFIAHCYDEISRTFLFDELRKPGLAAGGNDDITVLVGPEGDFSIDEVHKAMDNGYISVHLGQSRLRTETAAISALMMIQLAKN